MLSSPPSLIYSTFQRLARQGEHGIQSSQVFNILNQGDSIGKLHLRIANIGSVANVYGMSRFSYNTCLYVENRARFVTLKVCVFTSTVAVFQYLNTACFTQLTTCFNPEH